MEDDLNDESVFESTDVMEMTEISSVASFNIDQSKVEVTPRHVVATVHLEKLKIGLYESAEGDDTEFRTARSRGDTYGADDLDAMFSFEIHNNFMGAVICKDEKSLGSIHETLSVRFKKEELFTQ